LTEPFVGSPYVEGTQVPITRQSRLRRPPLLGLVAGAGLLVAAVSGTGLTMVLTQHVEAAAVRTTAAGDQTVVRDFVTRTLRPEDLTAALSQARLLDLQERLSTLARSAGLRSLLLVGPTGQPVASGGAAVPLAAEGSRLSDALAGTPSAVIQSTGISAGTSPGGPVLVEYLPLRVSGVVVGATVLSRDAAPILAAVEATQRDILILVGGGAAVLVLLLVLVFRAAQELLNRQTDELMRSARSDAITGLLNHGSVVKVLADLLAREGSEESGVGIAVIDIDNFRGLNEVHGHPAGDMALRTVAGIVQENGTGWAAVGRYGPDEFLFVSKPGQGRSVEPAVEELRQRLEATSLRFGQSESLPITISAGISHYPFHAKGVNDLLSAANVALAEAKASGGDALRTANAWTNDPSDRARTTFDVLQGLVNAIDAKDRYTKRHSEDVAAYAIFLAGLIDLETKLREPLRTAALLHDVGKIGIPDEILRKPGPLTPYEMEIVKQHVALGDLIVRDLPNLWVVRTGIRHHHERWDGRGYLDGLEGERIPLIARVLAVADAFSAMTTTRPYRKALPAEEALRRLEDAAGSQLEERLALAFVEGMRTAADAPWEHIQPSAPRPHIVRSAA
jgi:diguanylate cyclase (GGDEF)-like protein